ncbi:GPR1/FUN34/YaaH family transporter [Streptomyces sp. NBC_00557]|uniref:GPR1/FUN34/YaaH family transporter n=1 Tax=Streptomyces sp. NBC_00557 TaxID=2975776 RepID=UPI002E812478|nr:GPR1/FUN34/YaaH family transporter [Streptomyces sp. NBC_00557]WUC36800.1 GPR1/FUN34/YaaH family transporter [Streptomyces sp. NBC_00557]
MDNGVSAGIGSTVVAGRLALGVTLLAFGLGTTGVIHSVAASDAVSLAHYVGGVALFLLGLLAFRGGDSASGTGFAALGALWFTWAVAGHSSANAAGLFLLLFALVALTLTLAGGDSLGQLMYGLLFLAMLVLGVAAFADSSSLTKVGGWVAAVSGAVAWYAATAALAHWPTVLPRRAAGRGVTATG